ncbi:MAG: flagellar motor switch protein FliG [Deltaproteobacteria bacterium]|nr:flagellar motor switch protein FliG [Deltaproteobacteria bacterium]
MEKERGFTNLEKVTIVISSLPEDLASEIFRHMDTAEVERVSRCMSTMGTVAADVVDKIINEFVEMVDSEEGSVTLGKGYAENLVAKALGEAKAKSIVDKISEGKEYRSLALLDDIDPKMVSDIIRNEHPQTIALILAHLSSEKSGMILPSLPEDLRAEVVLRISNLEGVPPDVISDVAEMLENEVKSMGSVDGRQMGGVKAVADILNQMDNATESSILSKIEETDPKMADEIRQLMFIFDDLALVDDRGIQEILKEISSDDLAKALKTASEAVKEKIFKNMSERAVEMLNEDIEDMGPIRLSDVEKAQQTIAQVAIKLEGEGNLVIEGRGSEEVFV